MILGGALAGCRSGSGDEEAEEDPVDAARKKRDAAEVPEPAPVDDAGAAFDAAQSVRDGGSLDAATDRRADTLPRDTLAFPMDTFWPAARAPFPQPRPGGNLDAPMASAAACALLAGANVTRNVIHVGGGFEVTLRLAFADGIPVTGHDFRGCLDVRGTGGKVFPVRMANRPVNQGYTLVLVDAGTTPQENAVARDAALAVLRTRPELEKIALYRWSNEVTQVAPFLIDRVWSESRLAAALPMGTAAPAGLDVALKALAPILTNVGGPGSDALRSIVIISTHDLPAVPAATLALAAPHMVFWMVPRDTDQLTRDVAPGYRASIAAAGGATQAAALLSQRMEGHKSAAHVALAFCTDGAPTDATVKIQGRAAVTPIPLVGMLDEDRAGACPEADMLAGVHRYPRRMDLLFTPDQFAIAENTYPSDKDFKLFVQLSPDRNPTPAQAHYRGQGSRTCRRRNYNVNLEGKELRYVMPGSAASKFLLISNCADRNYIRAFTAYQLMAQEGLFIPRMDYVELFVNGTTQGVYTLMESPTDAIQQNMSGLTDVVRRDWQGKMDRSEPKWSNTTDAEATMRFNALLPPLVGLVAKDLEAAVRPRINVDQYFRWLALMNVIGSGDFVDEVYYIDTQTVGPDGRPMNQYSFMGWDQDDMFTNCHNGGNDAFPDGFGLANCVEAELDKRLLSDAYMYARYVDSLAGVLARNTTSTFQGTLQNSISRLTPFLENPATLSAMTELDFRSRGNLTTFKDGVQRDAAALTASFEARRQDLLAKIAIYRLGM